jgi:hypothetical protein
MSAASCPVCGAQKAAMHVACRRCWYKLPNHLRARIWELYRSEQGSVEHRRVVRIALEWLNLDRMILAGGQELIGCRNKHVKARLERENLDRSARQTGLLLQISKPVTEAA